MLEFLPGFGDIAGETGCSPAPAAAGDELDDAFSVAWNRTPFIEGGPVIWPDRGSGEYALLNEPAGRSHFAGGWLSYCSGWQAGAMDSARYVVQVLHRRVGAEGWLSGAGGPCTT